MDWYIYVTSFYFISTTATTVGYGDIGANDQVEYVYLIIVEFAGLCIFSIISGVNAQIIKLPTIYELVSERALDITYYLQRVDSARHDCAMESIIYDNTVEFIKKSYMYGVI